MANKKQVELLRRGSKGWNKWREENPNHEVYLSSADLNSTDLSKANLKKAILNSANLNSANLSEANLSNAILSFANLSCANLYCTNLSFANFNNADLSSANLYGAEISFINLRNTCLSEVYLSNADLSSSDLSNTNLSKADLSYTDLSNANLSNADLSFTDLSNANLNLTNLDNTNFYSANLLGSHALLTSFKNVTLTGACIQDWQIGSFTDFEEVKCDYIFRTYDHEKEKFTGRLPVDPERTFAPGEFEQWIRVRKGALDTIDITFGNGIDWQAFFQSLQITRQQHPDANVVVKSIEEEDGIFVARIKIETDVTGKAREQLEAEIETRIKVSYERQLADAQVEIKVLERTLDNALEKLAMTNKYTFNGPVGNVSDINHGQMIANINQNNESISKLITALRSTAQSFPAEQKEEALMELKDLERDIEQPEKADSKHISKRLQRLIAAGTAAATIAGEAATFSGNLNEFSENVLKIGENVGLVRETILGDPTKP